ncbi:MAG: transposase [Bacteroidetes bacterium]|nr:transposase [Bacteroidota bacterium]
MSRQPQLLNGEVCFITFTTTAWIDIFTRPVYKDIMVDSLKYCQIKKGLLLYAWCLMSNHIHMIAAAEEGIALNDIIRDMKKFTSREISNAIKYENESRKGWMLNLMHFRGQQHPKKIDIKVWKDGYDCFELYSNKMIDQKLNYIHDNPVRAQIVEEAHHYMHSSARNYCGMKGLLDVILI